MRKSAFAFFAAALLFAIPSLARMPCDPVSTVAAVSQELLLEEAADWGSFDPIDGWPGCCGGMRLSHAAAVDSSPQGNPVGASIVAPRSPSPSSECRTPHARNLSTQLAWPSYYARSRRILQ